MNRDRPNASRAAQGDSSAGPGHRIVPGDPVPRRDALNFDSCRCVRLVGQGSQEICMRKTDNTREPGKTARLKPWSTPTLRRIRAGSAELVVGSRDDGVDFS